MAKPILDRFTQLSQSIDNVIGNLDVAISTVDRTAAMVLQTKEQEFVEVLNAEEVRTEQEAAWLLHRWIETKGELGELNRQIAAALEKFGDVAFEHAMSCVAWHVKDKEGG